MDAVTILTAEYNYQGDILEILNIEQDIPTEIIEWRSIFELIPGTRTNPLEWAQRQFDQYLNI